MIQKLHPKIFGVSQSSPKMQLVAYGAFKIDITHEDGSARAHHGDDILAALKKCVPDTAISFRSLADVKIAYFPADVVLVDLGSYLPSSLGHEATFRSLALRVLNRRWPAQSWS